MAEGRFKPYSTKIFTTKLKLERILDNSDSMKQISAKTNT